MIKRFNLHRLFHLMCVGGILGLSTTASASAFQIWEQDGASVGNYHAGRVATANDASIAYYNPAGMMRIKNQQFVASDVGILTDIQYRGTIRTNTYLGNSPQNVTAQGGAFSQVPDFHYVAPLSERIALGLSLAAPFGLKTDYGRSTALRYAATSTELQVVDLSPSVAFNINDKLSIGAALDAERMSAQYNQMAVLGTSITNTNGSAKGHGIAYGYHMGLLYQFTQHTRVGLAYNSQVVHHVRGSSSFEGPLSNMSTAAAYGRAFTLNSPYTNVSITLPAFTTLSAYHSLNDKWAIMGTAIYTQWNTSTNLYLKNLSGISSTRAPSTTINANIVENYRNTWNFSVGTEYYATEKLTLRSGVGYDQTPTTDKYRIVQVPDNNRYAFAFGGHYQATKALGFDLGWTHLFLPQDATIAPPPHVTGAKVVSLNGKVSSSADIFGAQFTWNIT